MKPYTKAQTRSSPVTDKEGHIPCRLKYIGYTKEQWWDYCMDQFNINEVANQTNKLWHESKPLQEDRWKDFAHDSPREQTGNEHEQLPWKREATAWHEEPWSEWERDSTVLNRSDRNGITESDRHVAAACSAASERSDWYGAAAALADVRGLRQ